MIIHHLALSSFLFAPFVAGHTPVVLATELGDGPAAPDGQVRAPIIVHLLHVLVP
jgi:hypothetical protein